jgi:hypothetical protein
MAEEAQKSHGKNGKAEEGGEGREGELMNIEAIIRAAGFKLARQRKHRVYRDGDGRILVTASTPSDRRFRQQVLAQLCRVTGTRKHELLAPRKKKRGARRREPEITAPETADVQVTQAVAATPANPVPAPLPRALTRSERKLLKRMQK